MSKNTARRRYEAEGDPEKWTEEEFSERLSRLGPLDEYYRNRVTCALLGHSRIIELVGGGYYCARCGEDVEPLASYEIKERVIVNHRDCDLCRENYEKLTWKDKLFVQNPFKEVLDVEA